MLLKNIKDEKNTLRVAVVVKRKEITLSEKTKHDRAIYRHLITNPLFIQAKQVLCYMSTALEVDTRAFIEYCLKEGKILLLPKVMKKPKMYFYRVTSLENVKESAYGILEPIDAQEGLQTQFSSTDLCVTPGLAFSKKGDRLGYGGGFYDYFLKTFSGVGLGVCYSPFLYDSLPVSDSDQRVRGVVTEDQAYCCK